MNTLIIVFLVLAIAYRIIREIKRSLKLRDREVKKQRKNAAWQDILDAKNPTLRTKCMKEYNKALEEWLKTFN